MIDQENQCPGLPADHSRPVLQPGQFEQEIDPSHDLKTAVTAVRLAAPGDRG
jgi:hypothetical protein